MLQATKIKERRHSFRIVFRTSDTFCVTPPLPTHYDILMLKVDLSPDSFSEQEKDQLREVEKIAESTHAPIKAKCSSQSEKSARYSSVTWKKATSKQRVLPEAK